MILNIASGLIFYLPYLRRLKLITRLTFDFDKIRSGQLTLFVGLAVLLVIKMFQVCVAGHLYY